MRYLNEDVDKLNNSLKIEEVVGKFVELKKSGVNYKGICPFHNDTSPSFVVSPVKNICKCFVCGAGGNPITFYSNYKKIPFDQAIKELSEEYKIPLKSSFVSKMENKENEIYYEIMHDANLYFSDQIFENSGREALEYLTKRGITPENIKKNSLGYAPNSKKALCEFLLGKGYPMEKILDLGLVKENEKGIYDAFRNRVIFPIYSLEKRVIAFGGRTLENDKGVPKYINSPDTPVFKKGNILYGLGEKNKLIKTKEYAILMEGYMDVLMATIHGFDTTLAPLGTALTDEQGKLLKRYTENVILSFDMDAAGQKATEKGIFILKKLGFSIRVIEFKDSKDPDEYIKKNGKEGYLKLIKNSLECFDFLYNFYLKEYDITDIFSKQNFIKRFKEFFQNVNDKIEKSLYIDKLSINIGIEKNILWETLVTDNEIRNRRESSNRPQPLTYEKSKKNSIECKIEFLTVSLILLNNDYYEYFKNKKIENNLINKIFDIFDKKKTEDLVTANELLKKDEFDDDEKNQILSFSLLNYGHYSEKEKREKLLVELLGEWLRKDLNEFKNKKINILFTLEIKKIEQQLSKVSSLKEILELQNKFELSKQGFLICEEEIQDEKIY